MVAISTAWNARKHDTAAAIFDQLRSLGYDRFEINVHFTLEMVEDTLALVRRGEIEVVSVHNYCPNPPGTDRLTGGGDLYAVSSDDPAEREAAVKWGRNSIETAARLGARLMVGHWGFLDLPGAAEAQRAAHEGIRAGDRSKLAALREMVRRREEVKAGPLERALDTFSKLIPTARENGVRLGVENRNFFWEIPSLDEIGRFIALAPDVVGYWHDVGHAKILECLEVQPENAYRDRWAAQCLAVHVHDVDRGQDHLAMGAGQVDFRAELSAFPRSAPWIVETHHADAEAIRKMGEDLRRLRAEVYQAG